MKKESALHLRWLWEKKFNIFQLRRNVKFGFLRRLSPKQISNLLKMDFPRRKEIQISHESINAHLSAMPRGELKSLLFKELRRKHKHRRTLNRPKRIPKLLENMILIDQRPAEVEGRAVPGHWKAAAHLKQQTISTWCFVVG